MRYSQDAETIPTPRTSPPDSPRRPFGLYVHVPFCERKCPYCDFNTYEGLGPLYQRYVDALCGELRLWGERTGRRPLQTIFLGGGTPTVLAAAQLEQIVQSIHDSFFLGEGIEFTSEANPGTVDRPKFGVLRALGVNRLSMGVQSFQPRELSFLGRIHSVTDVDRAFDAAREAGFENINLDFMFGLPNQSSSDWEYTLDRAIALQPEHLSLYSLIVEPNTPLHHWVQIGRVDAPDDDNAAIHYELAMERMAAAGYDHYEVSNWARRQAPAETKQSRSAQRRPDGTTGLAPLLACRHNLIYWRNQEYIGVGPGAHSHLTNDIARIVDLLSLNVDRSRQGEPMALRWSNRRSVPGYVTRVAQGKSVIDMQEAIDGATAMGETMMLGLRLLREGVPLRRFRDRYAADLRQAYAVPLDRLTQMDLLQIDEERVRLTQRGLMVGNQVFASFLP